MTDRILAVADSDSYLKWGAATLDALPDVERDLVLLRSPVLPTPAQRDAALAGTSFTGPVPVLTPRGLRAHLDEGDPDVLLLAATGPTAELVAHVAGRRRRRPALVGGLPGMSYPATLRALRFRAAQDAFVTHSRREHREFTIAADRIGADHRTVLAPLPFLPAPLAGAGAPLTRVVLAPQARMPETRAHRERVVRSLATLAAARPDLDVVIKVRGLAGEAQTHRETYPFDTLLADLVAAGEVPAGRVRVATGPLSAQLGPGAALVTVSSTAALESLAAGLPTLVLDDFGVNERMLNAVFLGSGCLGSLTDLEAARFGAPDPRWLEDNYLHRGPSELPGLVAGLAAARRDGTLPEVRTRTVPGVVLGRRRRRLTRTWLLSTLPDGLVDVLALPRRVRGGLVRAARGLLRARRHGAAQAGRAATRS